MTIATEEVRIFEMYKQGFNMIPYSNEMILLKSAITKFVKILMIRNNEKAKIVN